MSQRLARVDAIRRMVMIRNRYRYDIDIDIDTIMRFDLRHHAVTGVAKKWQIPSSVPPYRAVVPSCRACIITARCIALHPQSLLADQHLHI